MLGYGVKERAIMGYDTFCCGAVYAVQYAWEKKKEIAVFDLFVLRRGIIPV